MPSFYLQSLFERQLEKLNERHAKVRLKLDAYVMYAGLLGSTEIEKVFSEYLEIPWGWRYLGEQLPEIPSEGLPFLDEFLRLNRREAALCRKMRNTAFWCCDSLIEPYVLWCYWWFWDEIEGLLNENRRLPLKHVRMLLDVLLNEEPRFPTREQVAGVRTDVDVVLGWDRTFRHKRRHLVWIFQTALRLEEEPVYSMM
jgi:hypothetical protein